MKKLNHGSLFSGIGGFDLAARWMNWENIFHVERNPFCTKILKHHFPESESYEDIYEFEAVKYRGRIDVLSGGFPCQPFSTAGKREGTNDERYLWPEMLRVIRDIKPLYIVGENVYGLVNWNAGAVFAEVVSSLEAEGYEVGAYVLPASAVNAPHRRDRIFFIAYSARLRNNRGSAKVRETKRRQNSEEPSKFSERGEIRTTLNSDNDRTRGASGEDARASGQERLSDRDEVQLSTISSSVQRFNSASDKRESDRRGFEEFPSRAAIFSRDDELSARLDGISVSRWRSESVKAYGNAVVPALIYPIFQAIQSHYENE